MSAVELQLDLWGRRVYGKALACLALSLIRFDHWHQLSFATFHFPNGFKKALPLLCL